MVDPLPTQLLALKLKKTKALYIFGNNSIADQITLIYVIMYEKISFSHIIGIQKCNILYIFRKANAYSGAAWRISLVFLTLLHIPQFNNVDVDLKISSKSYLCLCIRCVHLLWLLWLQMSLVQYNWSKVNPGITFVGLKMHFLLRILLATYTKCH